MRGSLDNPPIVVRESWLSWGGSLFLGVICLGASLFLPLTSDGPNPGLGWFGAIASAVFLLWRYFHPARIEIWPDRFVWVGLFPLRHEYAFKDIDEFALHFMGKGGLCVGFRLRKDSPRRSKRAIVSEVFDGADETFGGSWEVPPNELVDLLNRSRLLPSAWL